MVSLVLVLVAANSESRAQDREKKFTDKDYEQALDLFRKGGWLAARIRREKDPGNEQEWTLLVLTSKAKLRSGINGMIVGTVAYTAGKGITLSMHITALEVVEQAEARREFLKRFAMAIEKGEVAAALVKVQPGEKVDLPAFEGHCLTQKEFTELTGMFKFK